MLGYSYVYDCVGICEHVLRVQEARGVQARVCCICVCVCVCVCTTGVDCRVLLSEVASLKEVQRHKLDNKAPPTCLAYVPRGYTTANTHCLLFGTDVSAGFWKTFAHTCQTHTEVLLFDTHTQTTHIHKQEG